MRKALCTAKPHPCSRKPNTSAKSSSRAVSRPQPERWLHHSNTSQSLPVPKGTNPDVWSTASLPLSALRASLAEPQSYHIGSNGGERERQGKIPAPSRDAPHSFQQLRAGRQKGGRGCDSVTKPFSQDPLCQLIKSSPLSATLQHKAQENIAFSSSSSVSSANYSTETTGLRETRLKDLC